MNAQPLIQFPVADSNGSVTYDMIFFSPFPWNGAKQRPHHIAAQMALTHRIAFVELPSGYNRNIEKEVVVQHVSENLDVLRPNVFNVDSLPVALASCIDDRNAPVAWFYCSSFMPVFHGMKFGKIVYDCTEENANDEKVQQLFAGADVVFTENRALYDDRKDTHDHIFCFPGQADVDHFRKANDGLLIPSDIESLPKPMIGFQGTLDDRLDFDLIAEVATGLPELSFVFIGPLVNIEPDSIPALPNVHYLGMKAYNDLPAYVKAFNIAWYPYKLDESGKSIAPQKIMESMAALRPIVTSPVYNVVREFNNCVEFASTPREFKRSILAILDKTPETMFDYYHSFEQTIAQHSWSNTSKKMREYLSI
ncbi:MAG: glycosyltransferase [Bacteroidota bacterium]